MFIRLIPVGKILLEFNPPENVSWYEDSLFFSVRHSAARTTRASI
jgi:hypothetical protein